MRDKVFEKVLHFLLSALGAALVVWRNDAVQDTRLKTLEQAIASLQATTLEVERLATDLRVAVGVLDERSKASPPELDSLRVLPKRKDP